MPDQVAGGMMALSEREQRLFNDIEVSLRAEHQCAHQLVGRPALATARRPHPLVVTICSLVAGLALMYVGLATDTVALGLVALLVFVTGTTFAVDAARLHRRSGRPRRKR